MVSVWCTDWRTRRYLDQHFWQYQQHFPIQVLVSEQLYPIACYKGTYGIYLTLNDTKLLLS